MDYLFRKQSYKLCKLFCKSLEKKSEKHGLAPRLPLVGIFFYSRDFLPFIWCRESLREFQCIVEIFDFS